MAKDGLMLMLDGGPAGKGGAPMGGEPIEEDFDDFDADLEALPGEGAEDGPSPAFATYAETALGTDNADQVEALRQAILTMLEEGAL